MVSTSDLKVYKTTNNLGGAITATEVSLAAPNNLFKTVPVNELVVGEDYYAAVYLKNTHQDEAMDNLKIWLSSKSFPHDTEIKWGFDTSSTSGYIWSPFKNFNGSSDFVSIPDASDLDLSQFTVAAWFKTSSSDDSYILNKGENSGTTSGQNYALLATDTGEIDLWFWDTTNTRQLIETPLAYNDGNWHFAVGTYDGANLKIYIDGSLKATLATATTPRTNSSPLVIGRYSFGTTSGFWTGQIDEVRVWNNDLTAGEITALYADSNTVPQSTALVYENKFGVDNATYTAQTIANKYTSPTGISWNSISTEPLTPNKGKVNPGVSFPIWLWYHVNANAVSRLDDNETFTVKFDIPSGGTSPPPDDGGGGGGGGTPPPATVDYKIAIAGDWGCEPETDDVIDLIQANDYDYVVGVGDNAYERAECWTTKFTPLKSIMNSAYGNHEYSETGGTTPYKTFFGHAKTYFTFKFANIQFFVADTNINCDPGSGQHTFLTNALAASQTDNTVVWRIGIYHHPSYGSTASSGPSSHPYNEAGTRENFHELFQNNGVRIVCTGHNHNWQRTKMIKYNPSSTGSPTVVASVSPYNNDTVGYIHVVTGTGGHDSGSSLYGLGTQPNYQAYQNRTHNGIWEIISTNAGNTLTCSFVDIGGAKFDTFVIQNAITSTTNTDQFGITMLNATKSGGRTWFNNWGNGHARAWDAEPNGTSERAPDPDDSKADFHCGPGNEAIEVDGLGVMTMTGDNPRLYINDPTRVLKWNNVEMTVYYRALSDVSGASIFVHGRLAARTEHQDEYLCAASGHTAGAFEIKKDTTIQLRKELVHPAYADDVISSTAAAPYNTWIGMKLVLRDEGGNTRVIGYRDTTDGLNGGTWKKVVEKLDAGDWAFTDPTEIATYDSVTSGSGTCVKITPRTSRIQGAANSCYLRCDGTTVEFKKFSIREINAT